MPAPSSSASGFTLTELLFVVAIMSLLAVPSFQGISSLQARSFTSSVYDLSDTLGEVENLAVARNTFVWVGFGTGVVGGRPALIVGAYASRNGRNDATAANLVPVMRRTVLSGLGLATPGAPLSGQQPNGTPLLSSTAAWALPDQQVDGATVRLTQAILFSPTGEPSLGSSPLAYIDIGLQPLHGAAADSRQWAALQISGITGQTSVFRN